MDCGSVDRRAGHAAALPHRPRTYFEEGPRPCITAIGWVAELVELAGGEELLLLLMSDDTTELRTHNYKVGITSPTGSMSRRMKTTRGSARSSMPNPNHARG